MVWLMIVVLALMALGVLISEALLRRQRRRLAGRRRSLEPISTDEIIDVHRALQAATNLRAIAEEDRSFLSR